MDVAVQRWSLCVDWNLSFCIEWCLGSCVCYSASISRDGVGTHCSRPAQATSTQKKKQMIEQQLLVRRCT